MAAICDIALGRLAYCRLNKNRFHEKEGGQFLHTNGIYCALLAINSSKQRKDNQCLARYRWCLLSVYHDILTCSQRKLKKRSFFTSLVDNHISPYFKCLFDDKRVDTK